MPVTFTAELSGDKRLAAALDQISDPRVIAAALTRGASELEAQMRLHVSGPRPRRLDVVSGELRASFATDPENLPDSIRVGTPIVLWPELWETGKGRRTARPFAQPALEIALKRIPDFFVEELEKARDRAS